MIKGSKIPAFSTLKRCYVDLREIVRDVDVMGYDDFTMEYVYNQFVFSLYKLHFNEDKIKRLNLDVLTSRVLCDITERYLLAFGVTNEVDIKDARSIAKGIKDYLNANEIKSFDCLLKCTDIPMFCEILNKYGKPQEYKQNSIDKYLDDVCSVVFHDVLFKDLCLVKIEYFLFFYFKDKNHFLISEKSLHKRVFLLARKLNSWKRANIS
ncbi:MAG: hypothetical protein WBG43_04400 [Marinifilaceae bacterium]